MPARQSQDVKRNFKAASTTRGRLGLAYSATSRELTKTRHASTFGLRTQELQKRQST